MKNNYQQAVRQPYPIAFMCSIVFTFFLIHYSIWHREDQTRSSIPFTEFRFFQDFLSHPLHYIDPVMSVFLCLTLVWIFSVYFIESNRVLHTSDTQISWSILGYHYKTVVKYGDIQQIQYIEIPPKDTQQIILLRFKTSQNDYDLKLSLFHEMDQDLILQQLSIYVPQLPLKSLY